MSNNNKSKVVTGRGGAGNIRAAPLTLDINSMSHPQTAHILAQHEAATFEYETEVMRRHKEAKANKPQVSGRGGIGNITESNPRSPKPLRRASFFKGGGAEILSISTSPVDRLDMNAVDEEERRRYAHDKELRYINGLRNSGATPNLSPDSEYSPSDSCNMSIYTQSSNSSAGSGALSVSEYPASPISRERYIISKFRKRAGSKADIRPSSNEGFHRDLARAEMAASLHYGSYDPKDYRDDFLDFTSDTDPGRLDVAL